MVAFGFMRRGAVLLIALTVLGSQPAMALAGTRSGAKEESPVPAAYSCTVTPSWYGSAGVFKGIYKFGPNCRTDLVNTGEYWNQIGYNDWAKVHGETVPEVASTGGNWWYFVWSYYCGTTGTFKVRVEAGGVAAYTAPFHCP